MPDELQQDPTTPVSSTDVSSETQTPVPTPVPVPVPSVPTPAPVAPVATPVAAPGGRFSRGNRGPQRGGGRMGGGGGGRMGGGGRGRGPQGRRGGEDQVESEYEEKNLEIARVTRVTKGGKRMRFRALTVIGNRKGRVGFGLAKGLDVAGATAKATTQARKSLITIPLVHDTIPHPVEAKFAAARILLKPAPRGTGVKAGGPVRTVLELAGVPNITSKMLGSKNKINNVKATFVALKKLKAPTVTVSTKTEEK